MYHIPVMLFWFHGIEFRISNDIIPMNLKLQTDWKQKIYPIFRDSISFR